MWLLWCVYIKDGSACVFQAARSICKALMGALKELLADG